MLFAQLQLLWTEEGNDFSSSIRSLTSPTTAGSLSENLATDIDKDQSDGMNARERERERALFFCCSEGMWKCCRPISKKS